MSIRNLCLVIMFFIFNLYINIAVSQPRSPVMDEVIDVMFSRNIVQLKSLSMTSNVSTKALKFKTFELERTKKSARDLLSILPDIDVSSISVKSYNFETDNVFADLLKLMADAGIDRVSEGEIYLFLQMDVPDLLAEAAIQYPDGMDAYISYSFIAEKEPEGEYEFMMRKVCRARYNYFLKSYNKMSKAHKEYFDRNIFNTKNCQLPNFQ